MKVKGIENEKVPVVVRMAPCLKNGLKKRAVNNRRSLTQEIIFLIEQGIGREEQSAT